VTDKPLHVQVAEVLGWTNLTDSGYGRYDGDPPEDWPEYVGFDFKLSQVLVPRYDTDWAATGPLLEKYRISTGKYNPWFQGGKYYAVQRYQSASEEDALAQMGPEPYETTGDTTLQAACLLILALHKAGKLTTPQD
jgi:hypothetical protein